MTVTLIVPCRTCCQLRAELESEGDIVVHDRWRRTPAWLTKAVPIRYHATRGLPRIALPVELKENWEV